MPALAALDISDTFTVLRRLSPVKIVEFAIALGNDVAAEAISLHFEGNGWNYPLICAPRRYARAPRHCRLSNVCHGLARSADRRARLRSCGENTCVAP